MDQRQRNKIGIAEKPGWKKQVQGIKRGLKRNEPGVFKIHFKTRKLVGGIESIIKVVDQKRLRL